MNIYLVSQKVNRGYDSYDSFVVVADSSDAAAHTYPDSYRKWDDDKLCWIDRNGEYRSNYSWCIPSDVDVKLIGVTGKYTETTVICSSFNAG